MNAKDAIQSSISTIIVHAVQVTKPVTKSIQLRLIEVNREYILERLTFIRQHVIERDVDSALLLFEALTDFIASSVQCYNQQFSKLAAFLSSASNCLGQVWGNGVFDITDTMYGRDFLRQLKNSVQSMTIENGFTYQDVDLSQFDYSDFDLELLDEGTSSFQQTQTGDL